MSTRDIYELRENRRRLTFLSSSIALSFSFSSSVVASWCLVSNFSFICWLGMSCSAEFLSDFWAYCPSCWVCLSASESFFTYTVNKQQPSALRELGLCINNDGICHSSLALYRLSEIQQPLPHFTERVAETDRWKNPHLLASSQVSFDSSSLSPTKQAVLRWDVSTAVFLSLCFH